jgi:hypothetical protein
MTETPDNIIKIYDAPSVEGRLYDDILDLLQKPEYADLLLWSIIGVLDIVKMNLNMPRFDDRITGR